MEVVFIILAMESVHAKIIGEDCGVIAGSDAVSILSLFIWVSESVSRGRSKFNL